MNPAPDTGLAASAPAARHRWVDVARGIGIILVVWGHIGRANLDFGATPWAEEQDRWIYAFHMPLFFVLSGLFLFPAIARSRGAFFRGRWWAIVWPYLLWSSVLGLIEVGMAPFVNTPIGLDDVALIPVRPIEQFWFLYALLICQLAAVVAWPSVTVLWLIAAAGLAALTLLGGGWIGIRAFAFFPYVVAGISGVGLLFALSNGAVVALLTVCVSAWGMFAAIMIGLPMLLDGPVGRLVLGFLGSVGTATAAMLVARREGAATALLASMGRASLAIFVLHTLFSAGARIALKMGGIAPASPLSLALSLLAGLAFPYLAYRLAVSQGLTRQLGFGAAASPPPRLAAAPA
jgi:fucose 4-O-acetylase-like acetyltransferase